MCLVVELLSENPCSLKLASDEDALDQEFIKGIEVSLLREDGTIIFANY
jgi:hypothetical protein